MSPSAIEFTNTTPDPTGRFSVFDECGWPIHDQADRRRRHRRRGGARRRRSEDGGDGVDVATIELREGVRYEESVELELTYRIVDDEGTPSACGPRSSSFPAWGFGT